MISLAYEILAGLSYHSKTDCLVLNGRPDGVLQFFKSSDDDLKLSVSIYLLAVCRVLCREIKMLNLICSSVPKNKQHSSHMFMVCKVVKGIINILYSKT